MQRGRRIAFDYGDVRIGVAVCDPDAILASPVCTLKSSDSKLKVRLIEILNEYEPVHIYVGKPTHMDGRESDSSIKASEFAEKLREIATCTVEMIDERLSTVSATRNMQESGVKARDARTSIDQAAAVAILEFALEIEKKKR
ncbi:MAG: Holliday junction resolvase RuvX [Actinomycetes bacterium]